MKKYLSSDLEGEEKENWHEEVLFYGALAEDGEDSRQNLKRRLPSHYKDYSMKKVKGRNDVLQGI